MSEDHSDKSSKQLSEERTEKSVERTDYAEDRTLLANERTFAGWGRTALASIGLGVGFQALFKTAEPAWVPKCISTLFVLLGILLVWLAVLRANGVLEGRDGKLVNLSSRRTFLGMAIAVSAGGLGLVWAIWFLVHV